MDDGAADELGGSSVTDGSDGSTGPELNTITSDAFVGSPVRGAGTGAGSAPFEVGRGLDVTDFEARAADDSAAW